MTKYNIGDKVSATVKDMKKKYENKYILVEWPHSQYFIGIKGCYYVQPSINDTENLDRALFVPEEVFNETCNITATSDYIGNKLRNIEQIIRQSVSKLLIDTSKENPLECEIVIDPIEAFGLSSSLLPCINTIWQDPLEGYINFKYEGSDGIRDFDSLEINERLQVLEYLEDEKISHRSS